MPRAKNTPPNVSHSVRLDGRLVTRISILMARVYQRGAIQRHTVVPMVVPTGALLAGADWRSTPLTRWNNNGQR
jgi:hypothetical protein